MMHPSQNNEKLKMKNEELRFADGYGVSHSVRDKLRQHSSLFTLSSSLSERALKPAWLYTHTHTHTHTHMTPGV
jgi:hypothetical protein